MFNLWGITVCKLRAAPNFKVYIHHSVRALKKAKQLRIYVPALWTCFTSLGDCIFLMLYCMHIMLHIQVRHIHMYIHTCTNIYSLYVCSVQLLIENKFYHRTFLFTIFQLSVWNLSLKVKNQNPILDTYLSQTVYVPIYI